jgi:ATP sulfurylase
MLKDGEEIPVEFTRPEIAAILQENERAKVEA